MKSKKKIITILVIILLAIGVFLIFNNIEIKKVEDEYQNYTPQEEISEEQMRQTKVILYFENVETGELETETKIIDANLLIEKPYNQLFELLNKGPQSSNLKKLIPDGTILNDIIIENSCAIINVSNEFLNYENEENKLKLINSIVNTLTNLKEIDSVKFLIYGEENEKLPDFYLKNK